MERISDVSEKEAIIRLECLITEQQRNIKALAEEWTKYEEHRRETEREFYRRLQKIEGLGDWLKETIKVHEKMHSEMRTQEGIEIGKIKEKMIIYITIGGFIASVIINAVINFVLK